MDLLALLPAQLYQFKYLSQNPNIYAFAGDTAQSIAKGCEFRSVTSGMDDDCSGILMFRLLLLRRSGPAGASLIFMHAAFVCMCFI